MLNNQRFRTVLVVVAVVVGVIVLAALAADSGPTKEETERYNTKRALCEGLATQLGLRGSEYVDSVNDCLLGR